MLVHRRVVKQIVQLEFVLVHLWRPAAGSAPEAVEGREVVAAALVVALTRNLKSRHVNVNTKGRKG